jgi:hypothetical protein
VITQEQIDKAEAAVEAAELALDRAEVHHATAGSERAVTELRAARAYAHTARDRLRALRARRAAEQARQARRTAAEDGFPDKARKALARRLAAERDAAVAAIVAAEEASAELLEKVAAYSATVREAAGELRGRGLDASDGQGFGGTVDGSVRLDGEVWRPTEPGSLLAAVASSAVRARDTRHPFAASQWQHLGGLPAKAARDELLRRAVGIGEPQVRIADTDRRKA